MTAAPRRPFVVIAWIDASWWGHGPYDDTVHATSGSEAMQQIEDRLDRLGARVRSITVHETAP